MVTFSGVWDAQMQRRMVAFIGLVILLGVAYIGALASGLPITIRFFL